MAYLLNQLLSDTAAKFPDNEAIAFQGELMTYAELEMESNKLAHGLSRIGVERGERIGIYMNRSISSIVGVFGILKVGATYVPIDPLCPPGRLSYIIDTCAIKFLITSREKIRNIKDVFPGDSPLENIVVMNGLDSDSDSLASSKVINWQDFRNAAREDAPHRKTIGADLAYILFTSGSTGNPKGVMLSHLNALTFINSVHDFFKITMDDRLSNICPLHFDMSVFDIFVAIKAGATVVIIPETIAAFPTKLSELIEKKRITVWNSVPSALCLLVNHNNLANYDFSNLRLVLFAGEIFPLKYLRRLMEAVPGARYCNMYGQTEANSSTYYWVEQLPPDANGSLPIGKPLPNFEVFALDEEGTQVQGPGQTGELYVRASSVAKGYWREFDKTEKVFVPNPIMPALSERVYKTGDLVHLDSDGNYVFVGRKDHMIKSRGYRIEIKEIETVMMNHPDVKNAVVVPIPDELVGNKILAVVVPLDDVRLEREDILIHCYKYLPKYMIPEIIELSDTLPTTSSGKVDRKNLVEMYGMVMNP